MTIREVRDEIFKLLFEYELMNNNIDERLEEVIIEEKINNKEKEKFIRLFISGIIENQNFLVERIKGCLEDWTYERLGTVEKVLLKISFYEILIKKTSYEIAINEVLEIAEIYGDTKTKKFINGILGKLVKDENL